MEIDTSAIARLEAYLDGGPLAPVWEHPAYQLARDHADLLGKPFSREAFADLPAAEADLLTRNELDWDRTDRVREHVERNRTAWEETAADQLERIAPDADTADLPVYAGVGYSLGVGLADGAYVDCNEPLFAEQPRQLLYTIVHEATHVCHERVHRAADRLDPTDQSPAAQRRLFDTLFAMEAFATYAPLALRRREHALGTTDHPICADYAACTDADRLTELVGEYDAVRKRLGSEQLSRQELFETIFGGRRLLYRVGCAVLDRLESTAGIDAVREAFRVEPADFADRYDDLLDPYR